MKKALFIIILLLLGLFVPQTISEDQGWIIDGDKVYLDDSRVYLSAEPHTLGSGGWVTFELNSKIYSGNIDLVWGFNTTECKPKALQVWRSYEHSNETWQYFEHTGLVATIQAINFTDLGIENFDHFQPLGMLGNDNNTHLIWLQVEGDNYRVAYNEMVIDGSNYTFYYNEDKLEKVIIHETYEDWHSIEAPPDIINFEHGGMNKWYAYKNIPIVSGKLYKTRVYVEVPFKNTRFTGKYWWAIKPSSLTLGEAIAQDKFYYLDPWWDANWDYFVPITVEGDYFQATLTNFPVFFEVNSTISGYANGGASIRCIDVDNTTEYYHENEGTWNATGTNIVWVNLTQVTAGTDFTFLLYFSNAGASSNSNPSMTFYNGYDVVFHMDAENSTGATAEDSAGLSPGGFENATSNVGGPAQLDIGKIGNGTYINSGYMLFPAGKLELGNGDYSPDTQVYAGETSFTISFWIKYKDAQVDGQQKGLITNYAENVAEQGYRIYGFESGSRDLHTYFKTAYIAKDQSWAGAPQETTWNYITYTYNKNTNTQVLACNRSLLVQSGATAFTNTSRYGLSGAAFFDGAAIGADTKGSPKANDDGIMDELRITIGETRNDSWLDAEYNNSKLDFITFGGWAVGVAPRTWQESGNWTTVQILNISSWTNFSSWSLQLKNITGWTNFSSWNIQLVNNTQWNVSGNWSIQLYNWTWQWINVTVQGHGSVKWVNITGVYKPVWAHVGDILNFTMTPSPRCTYAWMSVNGVNVGNENPYLLTVTGDEVVIVNFTGSTFTYGDNDTGIPDITDVIDPGAGRFNWAQLFSYAWVWAFGGWFIAIILGIIAGALYIQFKDPTVPAAYLIVILIIYSAVTQNIAYVFSIIIALIIGYLLYKVLRGRQK